MSSTYQDASPGRIVLLWRRLNAPLILPVQRIGALMLGVGIICLVFGVAAAVNESYRIFYGQPGYRFWTYLWEYLVDAASAPTTGIWYYPVLTIGIWLAPIGALLSYAYPFTVGPVVNWIRRGRPTTPPRS